MRIEGFKQFNCKQCGKKCIYMPDYEFDICTDCRLKNNDQQLAELKAENERLANLNSQYATQLEQEHNKKPNLQNLCDSLQQQLKEKDELISRLRQDHKDEMHQLYLNLDAIAKQEERKQVCEKIRRRIDDIHFNGNHYGYIGLCEMHELIDKIEGELHENK